MDKYLLVACECSQEVTKAFREYGVQAYSCDLEPCYGGFPEWHIQDDAKKVVNSFNWDMVIAHPPCTYLSCVSGIWLFKDGKMDEDRYLKLLAAREFFMFFYNLDIRYCIENPKALSIANLPSASQIIQPYFFGEPFSKYTQLWLNRLPGLMATCIVQEYDSLVYKFSDAKRRSKTLPGVAKAMAAQWHSFL